MKKFIPRGWRRKCREQNTHGENGQQKRVHKKTREMNWDQQVRGWRKQDEEHRDKEVPGRLRSLQLNKDYDGE